MLKNINKKGMNISVQIEPPVVVVKGKCQ